MSAAPGGISFRLRRADRLKLSLLDDEGREIRTLVDGERTARGPHEFFWNGRGDDGRLVPEGRYRPKVELGRADRTIVLPNPITVDVTAPVGEGRLRQTTALSPDGDGRGDIVRVRYRSNERAHGLLFVNGAPRIVSRSQRPGGVLQWVGGAPVGGKLPPGRYRLAVQAARSRRESLEAGSGGGRTAALRPARRDADLSGARQSVAGVGIDTDARRTRWILRRGSSIVSRGVAGRVIRFRAPQRPGRTSSSPRPAGIPTAASSFVRRR